MSVPILRPYQQKLADDVRGAYRMGFKCPLVVASTGAGKTVLFSYITHGAATRGNPVIIAAHRKEIIRQISLSLANFGVTHQVIAAPQAVRSIILAQFKKFGRSFVDETSTTMVGSVQTIVSRFERIDSTLAAIEAKTGRKPKPLVVMDEGHHVVRNTQWGRVMDRYHDEGGGHGLIVTASPERLDGTGLGAGHGGYADTMIEAPPMSWLIDSGFLSPYRVFTAPQQIDLSGVHKRMGDYVPGELQERIDKPSVTGDAIQHWRQHAHGLRAIVFCVSISHSKHVADEFNRAGIPAAHIDGGIDDAERDSAIMDYADGKIMVLTNVGLVSEGFDLGSIAQKDVTIDCLIDLAPTESLVNAMQRWGRALRPAPGKTAVILDHAGNVLRHGLPDDEREWSLEGRKKAKRNAAANDNEDAADVNITTCTQCFTIHRPAPQCPTCGHVYPPKERKVEQHDGDLVELTSEEMERIRRQKRAMQGQAQSVDELVAQGMNRFRAQKIVQARNEKQALIGEIVDGIEALRVSTGKTSWELLGVSLGDIRRMKPKDLKELRERVANENRVNTPQDDGLFTA